MLSLLHQVRLHYTPKTPHLQGVSFHEAGGHKKPHASLRSLFPHIFDKPLFELKKGNAPHRDLKIGVFFSGGQAPGGHNVITGLFDSGATLIGFLDGPSGLVENRFMHIQDVQKYRNQGGFDLLGSGRTKIETPEQLASALKHVQEHKLDGLVVIGGDDSNTNAAVMAEYFLAHKCSTCVVGVPKTIDGDLQSEEIEISFGFDTAAKVYSDLIGNIARDALSAKKYYHFIRLMGRSASHMTLECALATHPNYTLISEEKKSLHAIVKALADLIEKRHKVGKSYGVILVPEGLMETMPELNTLDLPKDPHGNVQVSQVETERFLIEQVGKELKKRNFAGKFNALPHFLGYEGRCAMPSNFDANYCYTLGQAAAIAIRDHLTGVILAVRNMKDAPSHWVVRAVPLVQMLHLEERLGHKKPVIAKTLVDLKGKAYAELQALRSSLEMEDLYRYPGPIQFSGDFHLTDSVPRILH